MVVVIAPAAVWASHSHLHVPQRTARPVPLLFSSPLLVRRSRPHRWASDGLVGPSSPTRHCVLGPSRILQATDGFVHSGKSSAALHNGCAIPCYQHPFALVVWVVIAVGGGLMWVCFRVLQPVDAAMRFFSFLLLPLLSLCSCSSASSSCVSSCVCVCVCARARARAFL